MVVANNIEDAVLTAIGFFERMYQDQHLKNVLMEEVREKDENTWEVTIGYSQLVQDAPALVAITGGAKYDRVYKVLAVDKASGDVKSMVLRNV